MAGFDSNITVNVNLASAPVAKAEFNNILIMGTAAVGFVETHKVYTTSAAVDADLVNLGAALVAIVKNAFNQDDTPKKVYVGDIKTDLLTDLPLVLAADDSWFAFATESRLAADLIVAAQFALDNKKIYFAQSSDADILLGPETDVFGVFKATDKNEYVVPIYHSLDTEFVDIAWMADKMAINPDTNSTIFAYAELTGATANTLTDTQKANVLAKNVNYYGSFFGKSVTYPGKVSGNDRYIDEVVIRAWVKARIEEGLASQQVTLSNVGQKMPFTNAGIYAVGQVVLAKLARGERIGHFGKDTSEVTLPLLSEVSTTDRAARKLNLSAKTVFSGAIQEVTLNLYLSVGV